MIDTQDAEIKHHTNTGIANKNPRTYINLQYRIGARTKSKVKVDKTDDKTVSEYVEKFRSPTYMKCC